MIKAAGVGIPAHDEEDLLPSCLAAVHQAARHLLVPVHIVVVADACTDRTAQRARDLGAAVVETGARNVGAARAAGMSRVLQQAGDGSSHFSGFCFAPACPAPEGDLRARNEEPTSAPGSWRRGPPLPLSLRPGKRHRARRTDRGDALGPVASGPEYPLRPLLYPCAGLKRTPTANPTFANRWCPLRPAADVADIRPYFRGAAGDCYAALGSD